MKKLLKNKKGFTLIEMLIVVAIIVILVAISIPTFTANIDNARTATDDANLRAAKAAAITEYSVNGKNIHNFIYDVETGLFESSYSGDAYAEGSAAKEDGGYIVATVSSGSVSVKWAAKPGAAVDPE